MTMMEGHRFAGTQCHCELSEAISFYWKVSVYVPIPNSWNAHNMKILEEDPPLASEFKRPFLIEAFLYPISAAGMIHIAIFVFVPLVFSAFIGFLALFLSPFLGMGTGYILRYLTIPFNIFFYGFMLYYIAHCVFDSTRGRRRAPEVQILGKFGIGDFISQAFLLLGCVATCYWPATVYYVIKHQTDLWFWLMSACGTFFLPMTFLRGVMFDSFDALNPFLIILSIIKTFLPYCGLVLFFFAICGFIVAVLPKLPVWNFLIQGVRFYLVFVLAHRLGWFYWWHKDKLGWGI